MRRMLCAVLMLFAIPALAQYPEVDSARDALMAKDLPALLNHLPVDLQKAVSELPTTEAKELEQHFVPSRGLLREHIVVKRSESPDAVVIFEQFNPDNTSEVVGSITLEKRISDGAECMLQFTVHHGEQSESLQVLMKFVDSEWRIYELQDPRSGRRFNLDDPKLVYRIRNGRQAANESSAVGSMRSFNTAAVTYASTYPDIGYPRSAEDLGPSRYGTLVDEHHASLLDNVLTTPPFEKNGYRFTFKGEAEHYTVTAGPVKYGETGKSSFFTDETGVIRSTEKDEEATKRDEPLQ